MNQITSETVKEIATIARQGMDAARKVAVIKTELPDKSVVIVQADGTSSLITPLIPNINNKLSTCEAISEFVDQDFPDTYKRVFVSNSGVVVNFYDKKNHLHHSAEMKLIQSREAENLALLIRGESPKKIVIFLRQYYFDYFTPSINQLIKFISNYQVINHRNVKNDLSVSKESLGKLITNDVISEFGELPEIVEMSIPFFESYQRGGKQLKHKIRLNVLFDFSTEFLQLIPVEKDKTDALNATRMHLYDLIMEYTNNDSGIYES